MKLHRIYGLLLRYLYYFRHSFDRLFDAFYWPVIDLLIWGITSIFIQRNAPNLPNILLMLISGLLFWLIVWRAQYEISVNFLEELWNKNLVNLFVAPVKLSEWVVAIFTIGIIKMIASLAFASVLAYFLYATDITQHGWYLVPFVINLMMTGWVVGISVTGLIMRFGTKIQTLAWSTIAIISPFSAIYYPLDTLPAWAQTVARVIPTSYIFESGRALINGKPVNTQTLLISFLLNTVYLTLACLYFLTSFQAAKKKGLISVY